MTDRYAWPRKDWAVACALGWRPGMFRGVWDHGNVPCSVSWDVGWLTPSGMLHRALPPFSGSACYADVLLDWLRRRADVVVRPGRPDGHRIQAWWNEGGVEVDAPTLHEAAAEAVIEYAQQQDLLRELHRDEDEDEDDG